MIKLMYITNNQEVARIAESGGVERIFIDMEYIGKTARQGGMNTVQNHHTVEDVKRIKASVKTAELMVRCNPMHKASNVYPGSQQEIDSIVSAGADIIMLPYFKTAEEVRSFVRLVNGRAKTLPLVETPEAVSNIDQILEIDGIDEIFIGLNDLSLGYGKKFMFELLADGTVESLCNKFKANGLPYGFGGIDALRKGALPAERVIAEHYRLGSTCAILSRSFCNAELVEDLEKIKAVFDKDLKDIRNYMLECEKGKVNFAENKNTVLKTVSKIVESLS